jgi:orotidine-5'-phosphate decarboxylase
VAYADAAFNLWDADACTVNPYLGADAVEPFIAKARQVGGGIFVLVRTSNPGSSVFQNLLSDGKPVYRHVADAVVKWNDGRGDVGAVVGATNPSELKELRAAMPGVWFLVPGYGAQGGTAADVRAAYPHAIVNSSRGITFPFQPNDSDWEQQIETAARNAARELKL